MSRTQARHLWQHPPLVCFCVHEPVPLTTLHQVFALEAGAIALNDALILGVQAVPLLLRAAAAAAFICMDRP